MIKIVLNHILTAILCVGGATTVTAQSEVHPARPMRLIVPFSPGSSTNDMLGRGIAQRLTAALGPIVKWARVVKAAKITPE